MLSLVRVEEAVVVLSSGYTTVVVVLRSSVTGYRTQNIAAIGARPKAVEPTQITISI